ncbi:Roothairless 1 [Zea mays]|uniref:Roothairless 1 n=1 Tax=Zea mays TaxID=4577 RepID=A0A1D6KXK9_MAIZE|nr:Roothairless 1 [Zea mays]
MAKSSADDAELRRACAAAVAASGARGEEVAFSIRVAKGRGIFEKLGRLAKPRVLALTVKQSSRGEANKAFLRVLKYSSGAVLEPAKLYKLKHLTKVEVISNDPSGCTFVLGFDNLRSQSVAPPQWTMRNIDDRNRLLFCILNMCKEILSYLPKVVGIDIVELALWAKENTLTIDNQVSTQDGQETSVATQTERKVTVTVENDLVSQAKEEEEDMEALLDTYVMGIGEADAFSERLKQELVALEAANVYQLLESEPLIEEVLQGLDAASATVDDMDEWLRIFNLKLRHMREDIASIESRNNGLEMQSVNNKGLMEELDKLLERLRIPQEFAASLTGGSFEESRMLKNVEACEWLTGAIRSLEVPNLDPCYVNMRAVREKKAELEKLKTTFVRRASEFLRNYFSSLVDFMISDKSYFSQRGQLKRPDHADLRYKCRTYARLLQHLKSLDKSCLGPLRKAYCHSLNLLLRREAREFANELRASTKAPKNPAVWLEGSGGSGHNGSSSDTSQVSDAYSKMLTIFIPLLVDESSFFAHFMCFEVPALVPAGSPNANKSKSGGNDPDDDLGLMDPDGNDLKPDSTSAELGTLNEALQELLDGIQEDFYAVVDWAYKIDPLRCISMHGITERYLSGQKADAAGFVRKLLDDLESRISVQFSRVSTMFATLEKIAQSDPKTADIVLIENYAAFQNSLYDLANVVPTLAKFYHQASESYELACTRHISSLIYLIPFQLGLSKTDLRRVLKSSLSGIDKSISAMYRRLQKTLTSDELFPSLWDKCKKEFLDKYESFVQMVTRIYGNEPIMSVNEMKDVLAGF